MVEQIPFSIAESLSMKLESVAFQEIGLKYGLVDRLMDLQHALLDIKSVLLDAEEQRENNHEVENWVRRLKGVVYNADDLFDEFGTEYVQRKADTQERIGKQISYFFSPSNQLLFRYKIHSAIKDISKRLLDIAKHILVLDLIPGRTTLRLRENPRSETHSFVSELAIYGRDGDLQEIVSFLLQSSNDENISFIAIVGMAGLGKTALAQLAFNHKRVVDHFELRMWVYVSYDFDVKMLVKTILTSTTYENVGDFGLEELQYRLRQKLNRKRYLLILDDVSNESFDKWGHLGNLLLVGANGSKIIVTTRNIRVASSMGIDSLYALKGLDVEDSWHLFFHLAFRDRENETLKEIGREIVNMCQGVPLAIVTLGRILQYKTEISQWLSIRNNKNLMSLSDEDGMLKVFKLSYNNLPVHLKQCFGYCALFPKEYKFEICSVVQLWMAQGYVQASNDNLQLERIGVEYFEHLLSSSLFYGVENDDYGNIISYKMHNFVHDFVQLIVGPEILILTDDVKKVSEGVHHVSIFQPLNSVVVKLLKEKSLRTLFVHPSYNSKDDAIANTLISSCRGLRALHLNSLIDKKVPESIVKLSQLRYLDLSYNDFQVLPSAITRLRNLQALKLLRCEKLKELPRDIEKLVNLRHLEIQGCECLTHMPSGLGQLSMLQSLPLFVVGNDSVSHGTLSELKRLDHLRGELRIKNLEILKGHMALESMEANLKEKEYLQFLELEWQDQWGLNAEEVMEGLQPHPNLKGLNIKGYGGERFPSWMMNDGLGSLLGRLNRIEMQNCERCKVLPPFGLLPFLMYLKLEDLSAVEYMQESSPAMEPIFPSLKTLELYKLRNVKGWSKDVIAEEGPSFPCLSELVISCCHNLTSLPLLSSPCLSQLDMNHCDNFTSLILSSSFSLSKIDIKDCPNLTSLQLPSSTRLPKLHISGHRFLKSLALPSSPYLSELYITNCASLTSLELNPSPCLSKLHICDCPNLTISELPSFPCLEEVYLSYVSEELVQQLMCTSSSLKSLKIQWVVNLISLSEDELQHLTSLQHLVIHGCHSLMSLSQVTQHLTSLEKLEILHCRGLLLSDKEDDADDGLQFQELRSLHELVIKGIPKLVSLPKRLQHVTTLKTLTICDCSGMATLPNWICSLISLTELQISGCPKLKSLPEEMCLLSTLQILKINNCPHLSKRCQKETGEDWQKIHHVPEILLDGKQMTSS